MKEEFIISRTFDASRELLWKALTEPERMKQWFAPKGAKILQNKMDLRPGGVYHYGMQTPDNQKMWGKAVYREINKPSKLVYINSFSDEKGGLTRHPLSPTWPLEMLSTFMLEEQDGKTTLTVKWSPLNPTSEEKKTFDQSHESMKQGWTGTLDQLEQYLKAAK